LVFDRIKVDDSFDINTAEGLVSRSIYPLAIPGLAGPGSMMTVTLLTENYSRSLVQQVQTVGTAAISLAVVVLIYLAAEPINRWLGKGGLSVISRVMGLILSSIAVTNGIVAIKLILGSDKVDVSTHVGHAVRSDCVPCEECAGSDQHKIYKFANTGVV